MEEEGWKAREIENMFEESDETMKCLNKHSHFYPYGFTILRTPFEYERLNNVLRRLKKYTGLDLELSFVRKRKAPGDERTEEGIESDDEKSGEEVENDENEVENDSSDEVEPESEESEKSGNQVESHDSSSSEDEVCKSVKRMKFSAETSDESNDTEEESDSNRNNVCVPCKKSFSNRSNAVRHYKNCPKKK
jgi:hypothetical protein